MLKARLLGLEDFVRRLPILLLLAAWPGTALLNAAQESGYVYAADQPIPGATVTAVQGDIKVVGYTDERGHYVLNLGPGMWDIQVEILGLTPAHQQVTVGEQAGVKDFTMEMPKYGEASGTAATPPTTPLAGVAPGQGGRGRGRGGRGGGQGRNGQAGGQGGGGQGGGQGGGAAGAAQSGAAAGAGRSGSAAGAGAGPGFQNAQVTATQNGQDALAAAGAGDALGAGDDSDQAFLVNGSTSGGLGAASDAESQRQRQGGGPGGFGGGLGGGAGAAGVLGLPPGMSALDAGNLGLGGLGTTAINGGFGGGPDGGGGGGAGFAGGGGGGGGGGGRGGRGGGGGGGGGRGRGGARGNNQNQFGSFGNRRRNTRPAFTGSVALTLANSALNAAPFSLNGTAQAKPSSDSATYVGNLGGPMIIPKIMNWQRAQFQINYSGTNSRNPYDNLSTMPTPAERLGNFSGLAVNGAPVTIYDPLSGQPFPNNSIPLTRFDSAAAGLLSYYPQPTYSGPDAPVQNYRLVTSTPNNLQNLGVRLNAPLNNKDRLNFSVQTQTRRSASQQLFGFRDPGSGYGDSAAVGWNHSFAPRVNNVATVTYSRNVTLTTPYFDNNSGTGNVAEALGITGTSQAPIDWGPPQISIASFGTLSDSAYSLARSQTLSFTDNFTWVWRRKHNFTFGYMVRKMDRDNNNEQSARGAFSFDGKETEQVVNGVATPGTGFGFADFLLGLPYSTNIQLGTNDYYRAWATAGFAQDDYRVARGLTVNVGLRYEYFSPYTEEYGRIADLDLNSALTEAALVLPGQVAPYSGGTLPSSLVRPEKTMFSPRVGVAWRPSQRHSLNFRAGYSIFYSGGAYSTIISQMAGQPPFTENLILTNSAATPLTLENGFPVPGTNTLTNTWAINPNFKLPYAQNWTFTIAQTLPHNVLLEMEYIGTKGTDLGVAEAPAVSATGAALISNTTGFTYNTWGANSTYNAGQTRITRRFSTGMSAVVLYTYSKAIDDASSFTGTGGNVAEFANNWGLERGLSSFDQRNKLSVTYLVSSPVGVRGFMRNGGWKTHALAGWTLQGTYQWATGTPLTATVSGNQANIGGLGAVGGSVRAEATGLPIQGGPGQFFNPLAFTTPPPGQFGNAGVDTITGPVLTSLNAQINRAWRMGESRRQLQFRLSATNVLNHPTITAFGTAVNAYNYDVATAASATRTVTALFRFNF